MATLPRFPCMYLDCTERAMDGGRFCPRHFMMLADQCEAEQEQAAPESDPLADFKARAHGLLEESIDAIIALAVQDERERCAALADCRPVGVRCSVGCTDESCTLAAWIMSGDDIRPGRTPEPQDTPLEPDA